MSKGKCSNPKCLFESTGHCFMNEDPVENCKHLILANVAEKKIENKPKEAKTDIGWTGEFLTPESLSIVTASGNPHIIGIVGTAKAAKTSYLGMVYTLLLNGRFLNPYAFSNSLTLTAWEKLYYGLRFHKGNVYYPEPTPSNPGFHSIYHLGLKNKGQLKDVLFADASGEVFGQWAINANDPNASSVRWIQTNANSFIFFIDSEALIKRRGQAKEDILDIANRLKEDLNGRPVAIVWSKADRISEIRENIRTSLNEELNQIFKDNCFELPVSNYSFTDPDEKCHENNLIVLNRLLEAMSKPISTNNDPFELDEDKNDSFFNYGR